MSETHEDKAELGSYELGYHLVPSLGEDDLALRVTELQKVIVAEGGSIISEGSPQSFILAYTMRKLRGGRWDKYDSSFFGWVRFNAPAAAIAVLKDALDHDEHLIRYLILKLTPAALAPAPVRAPRVIPLKEVPTEPKALTKRTDEEVKAEVSEEELDKQIEELIK